jgi:hypothetical protein
MGEWYKNKKKMWPNLKQEKLHSIPKINSEWFALLGA